MKKFILSVVAVAAFASYNVYRSNNNETEGMSDTMLANVEALAYSVEDGDNEYECEAPFNNTCEIVLGVILPGYKYVYGE